jgi:hypothetical protein
MACRVLYFTPAGIIHSFTRSHFNCHQLLSIQFMGPCCDLLECLAGISQVLVIATSGGVDNCWASTWLVAHRQLCCTHSDIKFKFKRTPTLFKGGSSKLLLPAPYPMVLFIMCQYHNWTCCCCCCCCCASQPDARHMCHTEAGYQHSMFIVAPHTMWTSSCHHFHCGLRATCPEWHSFELPLLLPHSRWTFCHGGPHMPCRVVATCCWLLLLPMPLLG